MLAKTNRVLDISAEAKKKLRDQYGEREADHIIDLLIEERFDINRIYLALNPETTLNESQIVTLHKDIQKLLKGIPVQYIIGHTIFMDHKIVLSPDVLIPRPETEELVEAALKELKKTVAPVIFDIGTGSGAIAIALKYRLPSAEVYATDFCEKALNIAEKNANINDVDIHFFIHDILKDSTLLFRESNLIISNPPYIPISESVIMKDHVKNCEPYHALFVHDNDPLIFYKAMVAFASSKLKPGGSVCMELHEKYAEKVHCLFKDNESYEQIDIIKDIHNKPRIVIASKKRF